MCGLQGFIDGSEVAPLRLVKKASDANEVSLTEFLEVLEPNPKFQLWDRKGKIVMNCIYNSIS